MVLPKTLSVWTYIQSTGDLYDPSELLLGKGYSGAPGDIDNSGAQDEPDKGPIPIWDYLIGVPYADPESGPYTMRLTPDPSPLPDGRTGFKIHGDSIEHPGCASLGCIILAYDIRLRIGSSGDSKLRVVESPGDRESQPQIPEIPAGGNTA